MTEKIEESSSIPSSSSSETRYKSPARQEAAQTGAPSPGAPAVSTTGAAGERAVSPGRDFSSFSKETASPGQNAKMAKDSPDNFRKMMWDSMPAAPLQGNSSSVDGGAAPAAASGPQDNNQQQMLQVQQLQQMQQMAQMMTGMMNTMSQAMQMMQQLQQMNGLNNKNNNIQPAPGPTPPNGNQPAPVPTPPPGPTPPDGTQPPGPHKPIDSFTFSSNPQDPEKVRKLIEANKRAGKTTMVGIDPNNEPAAQKKLQEMARQNGAKLHLYLEGRGGPTGDKGWEKSEWERTRKAAASLNPPIHLTSQNDNDPAMKEWNSRGWQEHSIRQAREAKKNGFDSVEVDNINRLDSGDNTKRTMDFYRQYAGEYAKGDMPTLMMKNMSISELKSVKTAVDNYEKTRAMTPEQLAAQPESVRNNRIPREMFSDYHIFENDEGTMTAQHRELTRALGIRILESRDTENYQASGNFN